MSRSEIEHESIVTQALSASAASKPADHPYAPEKHTFRPEAYGLYDPALEKDSCGVGFIANIKGEKSHQIISDAISILCNLEHRGAFASKPGRGDRRRTQGNRRLSRACVIEKNLAWSQLGQQYCLNCSGKPGTGIATQRWRPTPKR